MARDPLTISDGCRDGMTVCRIETANNQNVQLQLDGKPCQKMGDSGYQCGEFAIYSDATRKKFFYLPGPRRGTLSVFQNTQRETFSVLLPQRHPVELAQWRQKLLKRAEEIAQTNNQPADDLLDIATITQDRRYFDRALAAATSDAPRDQAEELSRIAAQRPAIYPVTPLQKAAEALVPQALRLTRPYESADALNNLAVTFQKIGQSDRAKQVAIQAFETAKKGGLAVPLNKAATVCASLGLVDYAFAALEEAKKTYNRNSFGARSVDEGISPGCVALVCNGQIDRVSEFVKKFTTEFGDAHKNDLLRHIALGLAGTAHFAEALKLYSPQKGVDPSFFSNLACLAERMAEENHPAEAMKIAALIVPAGDKVAAYASITRAALRLGHTDVAKQAAFFARRTATEATDESEQTVLSLDAAEALADVGLLDAADRLLQTILPEIEKWSDVEEKVILLGRVARLFARNRQSDQAKKTALESIRLAKVKNTSCSEEAFLVLAELGEIQTAVAAMEHSACASYYDSSGDVLTPIARALVSVGKINEAIEISKKTNQHGILPFQMFLDIADGLIKAKRYAQAATFILQAAKAGSVMTSSYDAVDDPTQLWDTIQRLAMEAPMALAVHVANEIALLTCNRIMKGIPSDTAECRSIAEFGLAPAIAGIAQCISPVSEDQQLAYDALKNHRLLDALSPAKQAAVWAALRPLLKDEGFFFPEAILADYPTFVRGIDTVIHFRGRTSDFQTLHEFWMHREQPPQLPVALILYNTSDWNGAFDHSRINDALVHSGKFRVYYREVSNEHDFHPTIAAVHREAGAPIHTVIIAGHGYPTSLQLGAESPGKPAEIFWLDVHDFQQGDFFDFASHVDPKGQLLLYACSNGDGGRKGKNLANAFAGLFPPSFTIYSNQVPANIRQLDVKADRHLQIDWFDGPAYTVHGRKGIGPQKKRFIIK